MSLKINSIRHALKEKSDTCFDKILYASEIMDLINDGQFQYPGEQTSAIYEYMDSAFSQFLSKLNIPVKFYNSCSVSIQSTLIEYFLSQKDKSYLFRMIKSDYSHTKIRAVLSESYSTMDDLQLFSEVLDVVDKGDTLEVGAFNTNSNYCSELILNVKNCTTNFDHGVCDASISIRNSETGHSSIWIQPITKINGYKLYNQKAVKNAGVNCKLVHRGSFPKEKISLMLKEMEKISQVGIVQLIESYDSPISPEDAIAEIKKVEIIPLRFSNFLEEQWENETQILKIEAATTILELAKNLPIFQRMALEQTAGRMIGLFQGYDNRFDQLIDEL